MALMELAVDFGSSYITIYKRGEGIVLKEASVVVVSTHKKKTRSRGIGKRCEKLRQNDDGKRA